VKHKIIKKTQRRLKMNQEMKQIAKDITEVMLEDMVDDIDSAISEFVSSLIPESLFFQHLRDSIGETLVSIEAPEPERERLVEAVVDTVGKKLPKKVWEDIKLDLTDIVKEDLYLLVRQSLMESLYYGRKVFHCPVCGNRWEVECKEGRVIVGFLCEHVMGGK